MPGRGLARRFFSTPLRASGSRKLPPSPAYHLKACLPPSPRLVITCVEPPNLLPNSGAGSLHPGRRRTNFNFWGHVEMTISRDQIRELAGLQDEKSCALSFYFQPSTPRNKAHKEDSILIKDLARDAQRNLEKKGTRDSARADLERIMRMS